MDYKEKLKAIINSNKTPFVDIDTFLKYFPELKENEDERIRKEIIATIHLYYGEPLEDEAKEMIAWLEKQGEQKPAIEMKSAEESLGIDSETYNKIVDECIYEDDKVEPKFKVGDWITNGRYTKLIVGINSDWPYYMFKDGTSKRIEDVDKKYHLWTIQDAMDGDVLYINNTLSESIMIYKSFNNGIINKYASYNKFGFEGENYLTLNDGYIIPATKEQRDLLFSKIKEAGYEWDAINLKLNRISQRMVSAEAKEAMYDKPKWNVSDFRTWQYIVSDVLTKKDGIGQYLDSGECKKIAKYMQEEWSKKLNIEQKPAWSEEDMKIALRTEYEKGRADAIAEMQTEWSEEDKSKRNALIGLVEEIKRQPLKRLEDWDGYISWLKSLRPQNRWRPSEEQMIALKDALNDAIWKYDFKGSPIKEEVTRKHAETIESLYNDLKKLREE